MDKLDRNHIKIAIPIQSGPRKGADETLWAEKIEIKKAKIDNIPANAEGVSLGDIVEFQDNEKGFIFNFIRVIQKSGNKTISLIYENSLFNNRTKIFLSKIFPQLSKLGCEYEGDLNGKIKVIGINVPKEIHISDVTNILSEYKNFGFGYRVLSE